MDISFFAPKRHQKRQFGAKKDVLAQKKDMSNNYKVKMLNWRISAEIGSGWAFLYSRFKTAFLRDISEHDKKILQKWKVSKTFRAKTII
jgi:hypothetical protein